jgi:hypothetical protein
LKAKGSLSCARVTRGLTLPSRGRPTTGFASCRPPLMSNVRPLQMPSCTSRPLQLSAHWPSSRSLFPTRGRCTRTGSGFALRHRSEVLATLQQRHGSPRHRKVAAGAFRESRYPPEPAIEVRTTIHVQGSGRSFRAAAQEGSFNVGTLNQCHGSPRHRQ